MNSSIFNWEFKQKWIFLGKAYEWKKQYVELIHLPTITSSNQSTVSKIESFVDQILKIKKQDPDADTTELEREIDRLVYGLYELTSEEIAVVEGSVK
jgi:adenine-specific DNA-methyltransferase